MSNTIGDGLDVVVEGDAVRVTDDGLLQQVSDAYLAKYDEDWHFQPRDGTFQHPEGGSAAYVFEVAPHRALGFAKGKGRFAQTRWRFA